MKELRKYQRDAIDLTYKWLAERDDDPLIVLPTGSGKSLVIGAFIIEALEQWPDTRILCATHVAELLLQNYSELIDLWYWAPAGLYSAGLRRKDKSRILFGGVQSIWNKASAIGYRDLVFIDEAHLVSPSETTRYRKMLAAMRELNPDLRVIGLTATPYRLGYGLLYGQEDSIFGGIAYEIGIRDLIRDGYLSPLVSAVPDVQLDASSVHVKGGEYVQAELAAAVDTTDLNRELVADFVQNGELRRSWLLFGATVEHCYHLREELCGHGIAAECVLGETEKSLREKIIAKHKSGEIRCLVSRDVLTTGYNNPMIDYIGLGRPTMSPGLYAQMVGRGSRLADGKIDCEIRDYAGLIGQHGPVDKIRPPRRPGEGGEGVVKECPCCGMMCAGGCRVCPNCGEPFEFSSVESKLARKASGLPILSDAEPVWVPCDAVGYTVHQRVGKVPSFKVSYQSGKDSVQSWVCVQHPKGSIPKARADRWWRQNSKGDPKPGAEPLSVTEAMARTVELRRPKAIRIRQNGKFVEVIGAK